MICRRLILSLIAALLCGNLAWAQAKQSDDVLPARKVTLKGDLSISEALKQLAEQTGITVVDKRIAAKDDKLQLDLQKSGFWPALDAIAQKSRASISLYQPDGGIALVEGKPPLNVPGYHRIAPSYAGIFRGTFKKIGLSHDLDTGVHQCQIGLEFAWEPWFKPFFLEVKSFQANFTSGQEGNPLVSDSGKNLGQTPVHGRRAIEVDLRLKAPPRLAKELRSLKGELSILGPQKMLDVVFDKLQANGPAQKQNFDGVSVALEQLTVLDTDKWQVKISLTHPPGGPTFESFQSWIVNNKIYFQNKTNEKVLFSPQPFEQVLRLTSTEATINYLFVESKNTPRLGKPADWKLVYHTPGRIVEVAVPFAFKNIPLP